MSQVNCRFLNSAAISINHGRQLSDRLENSLKRLHNHHKDNDNHQNCRNFVHIPEKFLRSGVAVRFKVAAPFAHHVMGAHKHHQADKLYIKPGFLPDSGALLDDHDNAKAKGHQTGRIHYRPLQTPFHNLEGF